jgi:hypothetical protein
MTTALARKTEPQTIVIPKFDDEPNRTLAQKFAEQHEQVKAHVLAFRIETPEDAEKATAWALKIKETRELVAGELTTATELRRAANKMSERWNPAIRPLDDCLDYLRDEGNRYLHESRAAVAPALAQATSTEEIARATACIVAPPEGMIERSDWRAEITVSPEVTRAALEALNDERVAAILAVSIPCDYLSIDMNRADREAKKLHEAFAVPGLRAVDKGGVSFRG